MMPLREWAAPNLVQVQAACPVMLRCACCYPWDTRTCRDQSQLRPEPFLTLDHVYIQNVTAPLVAVLQCRPCDGEQRI